MRDKSSRAAVIYLGLIRTPLVPNDARAFTETARSVKRLSAKEERAYAEPLCGASVLDSPLSYVHRRRNCSERRLSARPRLLWRFCVFVHV